MGIRGARIVLGLLLAGIWCLLAASSGFAEDVFPDDRAIRPALAGGKVRTHYIAAEEDDWDYAPSGQDAMMGHPFMDTAQVYVERREGRSGRVHKKAIYVAYTDDSFSEKKPRSPEWAHTGILGPVLRAEVGDTLVVVFKNKTTRPYSMHPHGVFYLKRDEGAPANDRTTGADKVDDAVSPGAIYTYVWPVPERAGPGPADPSSIAWLYHSHTDRVRDTNAGLIGAMIVTRRGMAGAGLKPRDVDREFITLWKIFDEAKSPYVVDDTTRAGGDYEKLKTTDEWKEGNKKHAVNGFIFGNVPLMTMRQGDRVRWYLIALGNEPDLHTPHWHGNTALLAGHRVDVVPLLPAQHLVADMVPDAPGIWMIHCHVDDHLEAGMSGRYEVLLRNGEHAPSVKAPDEQISAMGGMTHAGMARGKR